MADLKPCPFCGRAADLNDPDTLYPGASWREDKEEGYRYYLLPGDEREAHGRVWTMHCPVTSGGCGAEITGDTREEAIAAWNRRPADGVDQRVTSPSSNGNGGSNAA